MKYLLIIIVLILFLVLVAVIVGYFLPAKHTATIKVYLNTSPENVWEKLQDFRNYREWRKNLKSVEVRSANSWLEIDRRNKTLPLEIITADTLKTMVTKIDGKNLPFGGTWIFTLSANKRQTVVTITENGEIYNPVFRFVSRFFIGYDASIKQYAADLENIFNHP